MPKQSAAQVGLPYNQGLMQMTGVQAKTPQYARFHQVYYKTLLLILPDNCQGAKVLTQVQHVLLQAYGRLLLKCDVWDAFATLLDNSPKVMGASTDMTPGASNHKEFRVEESSKHSVLIQRHKRQRVMEHMIIPEWEIYEDNAHKNYFDTVDVTANDSWVDDTQDAMPQHNMGHFEQLCDIFQVLMLVPDKYNTRLQQDVRKRTHQFLYDIWCNLKVYTQSLSENTTNSICPDIDAFIAHKDKTVERQHVLEKQTIPDQEDWAALLVKIASTLHDVKADCVLAQDAYATKWLLEASVANELTHRLQCSVYVELHMTSENEAYVEYRIYIKLFSS